MSMTSQEEFAARLARVKTGGAHTKGTIFVGQDEQHHINRVAPQKQAKGKEVASNALYPLSLVGAFLLGLLAAALGRYAQFQLWEGREALGDDADIEMVLSFGVGILLSFVLAQMFRITSKEHKGLQAAGVFAMVCGFHNFAYWAPGLMSGLLSPSWVANVQAEATPNSAKFRGLYFPLFEEGSLLAKAGPPPASPSSVTETVALPDCPAKAEVQVVVLQTENAQKPKKGAHKTVAASADQAPCKAP